ncbi:hypothetical protein [Streptosporangium sp. 'caverna']|uniref:hypothetical protein n=1 Tax=Streptosporangium sp. 'caverna' TaxID=2202249 RepID=UPI000D7E1410|nr:hypothetical protein [Streptosporangium sp. 'caverna']AWS40835.1 hypothetical protein DKM19_05160 [Streptosporangium sp. 'caverna']
MLTRKNVPAGRRSWAWFVVAVGASLVPWALLATMEGGWASPRLPLAVIAGSFVGISARDLIGLDVFVIGVLPLLISIFAVARSRTLIGAISGVCGVLALLHLVPVLGALPITLPPADATADMLAGSQPDHYFGTLPYGGLWALAPIAYAASAIALLVAARRGGRGMSSGDWPSATEPACPLRRSDTF